MESFRQRAMTTIDDYFRQSSYSICAMKLLYNMIKNSPEKDPEAIFDDFRADMDYYALMGGIEQSFIFSAMFDTATYFYDMFFINEDDDRIFHSVMD